MANSFSGSYFYQIDDKGRMRVPPEFRNSLGGDLHIGYGFGKYLVIYTAESYERECQKSLAVNPIADRQSAKYYRDLFASMRPFDCDQQGRFKVPADFRKDLGLVDEVVIVGYNQTVEIWSKKFYDRRNEDEVAYYRLLSDDERRAADERTALLNQADEGKN